MVVLTATYVQMLSSDSETNPQTWKGLGGKAMLEIVDLRSIFWPSWEEGKIYGTFLSNGMVGFTEKIKKLKKNGTVVIPVTDKLLGEINTEIAALDRRFKEAGRLPYDDIHKFFYETGKKIAGVLAKNGVLAIIVRHLHNSRAVSSDYFWLILGMIYAQEGIVVLIHLPCAGYKDNVFGSVGRADWLQTFESYYETWKIRR